MRRLWYGALLVTVTGCASPTAPTLTPTERWALEHANEVCVLRDGRGVLMRLDDFTWRNYPVEPISYCNPAE